VGHAAVKAGWNWIVRQFEITPKAFANFSPRVASTLGKQTLQRRILKEFAKHLANAFSVS
jgi:hypothetical protein